MSSLENLSKIDILTTMINGYCSTNKMRGIYMKFKGLFSSLLVLCVCLNLTACSYNVARPLIDDTEITLWTYPIGDWGNKDSVEKLLKDFAELHPEIFVKVKYLDYKYGDKEIAAAIKTDNAPDIVLEGPERLVANWGNRGLMVDLSDMYGDSSRDIYENVVAACRANDGKYYEYPLCMATHCMAINKSIFEKADALQYLNLSNYTWTTENFFKAVDAISRSGQKDVLNIYCNGQSGDQGSRALVNNLYDGSFTDNTHQHYTIDSTKNVAAVSALISRKGISITPDLTSSDEIEKFRKGKLAMSICWNPSPHNDKSVSPAGKTVNGDEIIPMHFPSPNGSSKLVGGIWGFGIFNNKNDNKIKASKIFIDYMANHKDGVRNAVKTSHFFPVHKEVTGIYDGTAISNSMNIFSKYFMLSMGDYYQVTPGWAEVRPLWWNALKDIANGKDIKQSLTKCNNKANKIADTVRGEASEQY